MIITPKNAAGTAMLAIAIQDATELDNTDVEPYMNGRESGWCLRRRLLCVVFCEDRNGAHLTVYTGTERQFSPQGWTPGAGAIQHLFPIEDYVRASRFGMHFLQEGTLLINEPKESNILDS